MGMSRRTVDLRVEFGYKHWFCLYRSPERQPIVPVEAFAGLFRNQTSVQAPIEQVPMSRIGSECRSRCLEPSNLVLNGSEQDYKPVSDRPQ